MSIPRMDYKQYRKMRKLVHECCNYDDGNCIALDDGNGVPAKSQDFVGRGGAAERTSFRACAEASDTELATPNVCVQSISYSLLCKWFRAAVLPLDNTLYAVVIAKDSGKRCAECGALFASGSNRAKYCPSCSQRIRRRKEAERQRKLYYRSTHLGD